MITTQPMSWETFEQQIQICLNHLYDYTFLQSNALVHLLVSDRTGPDRVDNFRTIVFDAIERLRPGATVAFHSKAARTYNILSMRYVVQQQTSEVIKQLAMSERQFYRDHPKAIRSLSSILWERLTGTTIPEITPLEVAHLSVQTEVQSLSEHSEIERLNLANLLAGVVDSLRLLASENGVRLISETPEHLIEVDTHRTLLRQLVLAILFPLVTNAGAGATVCLSIEGKPGRTRIVFSLTELADPDGLLAVLDDQETLPLLVKTLKANLRPIQNTMGEVSVTLEISMGMQTVLIVDDNPDAIDLFQHYLSKQRYQVLVAYNGAEALQIAREAQPNVIILDIMLPGQDGLEVLQNLKHHELTLHIPVLICSILDMQALALLLGANDYLRKPPEQDDLLRLLDQWSI